MKYRPQERSRSRVKWPAPLAVIGRSIVEWWDTWLDYEIITLAWVFAQVTIILGPPATFGMYYVANTMAREGQALGIKGMIEGARMYFGKALLWGLLNWAAMLLAYVNFTFYSQISSWWGAAAEVLVTFIFVLWLVTQFYAVPFFMEQTEPKILLALRNGLFTALASPGFTFVLMLFVLLLIGLSAGLIIPLFLGAPGLIATLGTRALFNRLVKFGLKKDDPDPRDIR